MLTDDEYKRLREKSDITRKRLNELSPIMTEREQIIYNHIMVLFDIIEYLENKILTI